MTSREILEAAMCQSAIDCSCAADDFRRSEPVTVLSKADPRARKYLTLPFDCNLVSYGRNVVASVSEAVRDVVTDYIRRCPTAHCMETPNLHLLSQMLEPFGLKICFMAEYFLPDPDALKPLDCPYPLRMLYPADFQKLYLPQWSNALCQARAQLDTLGIGAYDKGELVGFAACSADCDDMYQIGIDVLPQYRHQGIASALTSRLALEILRLEKIPFYCAAWCNIPSVRNAIRCGFRPAWTELTAKPAHFVRDMISNL